MVARPPSIARESERVSYAVVSDSLRPQGQQVACQALLSTEFFRQEYWSGLPFPSPGDLPHQGIEPEHPALQAESLPSETPGKCFLLYYVIIGEYYL